MTDDKSDHQNSDEIDLEISEDEIKISAGGTNITLSGVLDRKHALILIALILGMLGIGDYQGMF